MGAVAQIRDALERLEPRGVCARALTYGVLASLFPLMALLYVSAAPAGPHAIAAVALVFTLFSVVGLVRALRPIATVALMLDRHARGGHSNAGRASDDCRQIIANFQTITSQLDASSVEPPRHAVSGLPLREEFLGAVARDLAFRSDPALLGLIRLANFDHVVAFDANAAQRLLKVVAERLTSAVGPARPVAHVDRDCFAVWYAGQTADAARAEFEALGYVLMREIEDQGGVIVPDIQLGSALHPVDADEPDNLLNRAFVSLVRPQRTAEGAIAYFARPTAAQARRRFSLEQNLRHAVRRGELTLQYQPFIDLAVGGVTGAEALLRWRSSGVEVSPTQIVPILEESGLIHEFGLWTMNAACKQLREWRDAGHTEIKMAVNLSAHQLRDGALASALARTVASHGLNPAQIELELTETAAMGDADRTLAIFEQLREVGFSLAIDDFGSGYSSLAYLRRLPFQKLKIDREFVSHVDTRADSRTICRALIDLTAGLELAVLAEGVERIEEVETLRSLGCQTFQGFYFSRPLAGHEFIATVTDAAWLARTRSSVRRQHDELRRRLS
ncbi:EAL domain-containing protein [Terricaulis sp.]|uniref:putative bifunctional diguanylate cyclase/phosphodiesterase n=1 Tax=Terricaulis sp. TaxID=2768686 RepID=UPI002AC4AB3B|nr:EAL domain-containing protein [Terricaulis sp.]MDZ4691340.1 EAL domain-containing protein [Terricaulis sp.]